MKLRWMPQQLFGWKWMKWHAKNMNDLLNLKISAYISFGKRV